MHSQNSSYPSNFFQTNRTKNKYLNFTLLALTALFATILLSTLPSSQTSATATSQQLPYPVVPLEIRANTDDTLSYYHCQTHAYNAGSLKYYGRKIADQFHSYINTRTVVNGTTVINPWISSCAETILGRGKSYFLKDDGSLVGNFELIKNSGETYQALALYRDGEFKWERNMQISCPNSTRQVGIHWPTQGYDGNIYGIMVNLCDNAGHKLVSVAPETGSIRFEIPLSSIPQQELSAGPYLAAYSNGIVLLDNNKLRYIDYQGIEDSPKEHSINTPTDMRPTRLTVSPDGTAYTWFRTNSGGWHQPCESDGLGYDEIYYFNQQTQTSDVIEVDSCGAYAEISQIAPDPNGGLIILTEKENQRHYIIRYKESGELRNVTTVPYEPGWSTLTDVPKLHVDNFGNVVITRDMKKASGDNDQHVMAYLITPSGAVSKAFSTEQYDTPQTQKFAIASLRGASLREGNLYIGICHTACTHTNPAHIYTVNIPGVGNDYPSNLIGTAIPNHDVDADGDGLTKWQEVQQQTADDNTDSDGDGLNDFLESRWNPDRHDLFCNGDQSVCEYPTPHEKDVYVEVDWMTRPADGNTDSYTTKPNETQINEIKDAFAAKGIHAHFDTGQLGGGNEVPYNEVVKFGIFPNEADFFDYKKGGDGISAQFNQDRYKIYHYMLSGYRFNDPPAPASSGVALVSDDDFFVSFGALKEDFGFILPGQAEKAITGTIIHELGHNLCLTGSTHNEPECSFAGIDANYGNDYPSAMNYDKQFELIDYSTGQNGANDHDDWGAIRLQDFIASNAGDEEHDLLQSMQMQSTRSFTPLKVQPQYRELQNKLKALEKRIERHEDR